MLPTTKSVALDSHVCQKATPGTCLAGKGERREDCHIYSMALFSRDMTLLSKMCLLGEARVKAEGEAEAGGSAGSARLLVSK